MVILAGSIVYKSITMTHLNHPNWYRIKSTKKTYHINIYEINHEQSQKTFTFEMALSASSGEETNPEIQPAPGQLMR